MLLGWGVTTPDLVAHPQTGELAGHSAATYEIGAPDVPPAGTPQLLLNPIDGSSGKPLAVRFSLEIDGQPHTPRSLSSNGIRFTSIHSAKKQRETFLFTRGTGPVRCEIPAGTSKVVVTAAKGYEFAPFRREFTISGNITELTVPMRRWIDLGSEGWHAGDQHLHYERLGPEHDHDWATLLRADGLRHGFFMVLKGGNLPGIWAEQYAFGAAGTHRTDQTLLVPGEEFRGKAQGHINLHGIGDVIEPVSIGGMGPQAARANWPPMHDVLRKATAGGAIGGAAHGGTFGTASTVHLDAIMGASGFIELANTHLYELGPWYELLNCGVLLPPAAGTDLPNFPFRDAWQPLLGETRMYVRIPEGEDPDDFDAWKRALRAGRVFVTSGPVIRLTVNGAGLGDRVPLGPGGGELRIRARLSSPLPLDGFDIVLNGSVVPTRPAKERAGGLHHWSIDHTMPVTRSCWIAARGTGARKMQLWNATGINQRTAAHTAAIPVMVGKQPIRSKDSVKSVRQTLEERQRWYAEHGSFPGEAARARMLGLFDEALERLPPSPR